MCPFTCEDTETVEHFINKCPLYDQIRLSSGLPKAHMGTFLDLDTPPPVKRQKAMFIKKALAARKMFVETEK